ncbi:MAG TPA: hypothetical protein ENI68_11585 [Gammaproteobacteria bacterium]|mgnify:CR=1 FL=1|nr:hypothetical protein [Gammaproteobacteria bacterium]
MTNRYGKYIAVITVALSMVLTGCNMNLNDLIKPDNQSEKILAPTSADVSPNMDFNKVRSVALFPLFPGSGVIGEGLQSYEDPKFAGSVVQALSAELTTKQSQWKIRSPGDVLNAINKKSLGRGYKNLQADYNTSSGQLTAFTAQTQRFLKSLASAMKVDAFIFGNYQVASGSARVKTLLGVMKQNVTRSKVNVALYYVKNKAIWWRATSDIQGTSSGAVASNIAKSLASHVGKGTLRQL